MFCALCGDHARHTKSPQVDLRRKDCPRFPNQVIHRGCCAEQVCSDIDTRGHVRCGWEFGGKERLLAQLVKSERSASRGGEAPSARTAGARASGRT